MRLKTKYMNIRGELVNRGPKVSTCEFRLAGWLLVHCQAAKLIISLIIFYFYSIPISSFAAQRLKLWASKSVRPVLFDAICSYCLWKNSIIAKFLQKCFLKLLRTTHLLTGIFCTSVSVRLTPRLTLHLILHHQNMCSIKSRLSSEVVSHKRMCSIKSCPPSKVDFRQRSSSGKGHL